MRVLVGGDVGLGDDVPVPVGVKVWRSVLVSSAVEVSVVSARVGDS